MEQELHDKATRGLPLSKKEKAILDRWYAEQDAIESARLRQTPPQASEALKAQIDSVLTEIQVVTERIRKQEEVNETAHRELAELYRQLEKKKVASSV